MSGGSETDLPASANVIRDHVFLQIGTAPTLAERESDGFRASLAADIAQLKNSQGDHAVATAPTLPCSWSKFGSSLAVDSAKLFAVHLHRLNVQALSEAMDPIHVALESHTDILEVLRQSPLMMEEERLERQGVKERLRLKFLIKITVENKIGIRSQRPEGSLNSLYLFMEGALLVSVF